MREQHLVGVVLQHVRLYGVLQRLGAFRRREANSAVFTLNHYHCFSFFSQK